MAKCNPIIEQIVLAGIFRYGKDAFIDIQDIIDSSCFSDTIYQIVFRCFERIFENDDIKTIDISDLIGMASLLNLDKFLNQPNNLEKIKEFNNVLIEKENVRGHAQTLRKIHIINEAQITLKKTYEELEFLEGNESISEILTSFESPILDFSRIMGNAEESTPSLIFSEGIEYLEYLEENPNSGVGISTGYKCYDYMIGGGLRNGEVDLITARPGIGKSTIARNIGVYIARNNIPVLLLDGEMKKESQMVRVLSSLSNITINDIEDVKFADIGFDKQRLYETVKQNQTLPLSYISTASMEFNEILSVCRRWFLNTIGTGNPGVIIYDYLKLNSASSIKNMAEYQAMGFQIIDLHNFAAKYDIPILAFVQPNREGEEKETLSIISQSDRLGQNAASAVLLKVKSQEEITEDGMHAGNMKMVKLKARYGPSLKFNDYICLQQKGAYSIIKELGFKSVLIENRKEN